MPTKKSLLTTVHVHQDDGTTKVYGPGDTVPAADAKKIINPKAWAESDADSEAGGLGDDAGAREP